MNVKVFPVVALAVVLVSGAALVWQLQKQFPTVSGVAPTAESSSLETQLSEFFADMVAGTTEFFDTSGSSSSAPAAGVRELSPRQPSSSPSSSPQPTASPTPSVRPAASPTPVPATPTPTASPKSTTGSNAAAPAATQKAACTRFRITHLDGSSSNRCYNDADYASLASLASQAKSAETFYQFHMDGVARYHALYEQSGSDLWLDAKASSQTQADQEREKMGSLHLQMYTIESRGVE